MSRRAVGSLARPGAAPALLPSFLLCHRHRPEDCRFAFAAWRGTDSPLRHTGALSSCPSGDHGLWWVVAAADADAALSQLPEYLRRHAQVIPVQEVPIP